MWYVPVYIHCLKPGLRVLWNSMQTGTLVSVVKQLQLKRFLMAWRRVRGRMCQGHGPTAKPPRFPRLASDPLGDRVLCIHECIAHNKSVACMDRHTRLYQKVSTRKQYAPFGYTAFVLQLVPVHLLPSVPISPRVFKATCKQEHRLQLHLNRT